MPWSSLVRPLARRLLAVAAAGAAGAALAAAPAGAHGVGGRDPTNVRSRVVAVDPPVSGLEVEVVELGERVELRNRSPHEVVVLGYDGEPYLRTGPGGAFENARSPAVFVNRSLEAPGAVPAEYDAAAEPRWRRLGAEPVVRWHDHRAHWMGDGRPDPPGAFTIGLRVDGRPVEVRGEISWVGAPAWWPWPLAAVSLAAGVVAGGRRAWRAVVAAALAAVAGAEVAHVAGSWSQVASGFDARLGAQSTSAVALVAAGVALAQVAMRDAHGAAPWVLLAAVAVGVVAVGDVVTWWRSQLPSSLPAGVVRALVAVTLGGAVGLAVAAAPRLRAPAVRGEDPHL